MLVETVEVKIPIAIVKFVVVFRNVTNLFCKSKSMPGLGAFLINSLARSFFPVSSFWSKDPTTGVWTSKVEMSSNTSSSGFCHRKIILAIGSNFCVKLALLSLSCVT